MSCCCRCNVDPKVAANRYIREAARSLQLVGIYFTEGNSELPADHPLNLALAQLAKLDIETAYRAGTEHDPVRFKLFGKIQPCGV